MSEWGGRGAIIKTSNPSSHQSCFFLHLQKDTLQPSSRGFLTKYRQCNKQDSLMWISGVISSPTGWSPRQQVWSWFQGWLRFTERRGLGGLKHTEIHNYKKVPLSDYRHARKLRPEGFGPTGLTGSHMLAKSRTSGSSAVNDMRDLHRSSKCRGF